MYEKLFCGAKVGGGEASLNFGIIYLELYIVLIE
jgi:hypothetical protein